MNHQARPLIRTTRGMTLICDISDDCNNNKKKYNTTVHMSELVNNEDLNAHKYYSLGVQT